MAIAYWALKVPRDPGHTTSLMPEQATTSSVVAVVDVMNGGFGNDELRGGYGHGILDGGFGEDILYGGGGRNTFNNNDDGELDQIFVLSDYHSHNQPTGRLHNGANADTISSLGEEDKITILGATTDELSIRQLNDGLGIFASGPLEAIVTDSAGAQQPW